MFPPLPCHRVIDTICSSMFTHRPPQQQGPGDKTRCHHLKMTSNDPLASNALGTQIQTYLIPQGETAPWPCVRTSIIHAD